MFCGLGWLCNLKTAASFWWIYYKIVIWNLHRLGGSCHPWKSAFYGFSSSHFHPFWCSPCFGMCSLTLVWNLRIRNRLGRDTSRVLDYYSWHHWLFSRMFQSVLFSLCGSWKSSRTRLSKGQAIPGGRISLGKALIPLSEAWNGRLDWNAPPLSYYKIIVTYS